MMLTDGKAQETIATAEYTSISRAFIAYAETICLARKHVAIIFK